MVAGLGLTIAFGNRDVEANRHGALSALARNPIGRPLLVVFAAGFAGYAAWRLLDGSVGKTDKEGLARWAARGASLLKGVLYVSFFAGAVKLLVTASSENAESDRVPRIARVMQHTGGRWIVALVGLAIAAWGLSVAVRGVRQSFTKHLKRGEMGSRMRRVVDALGAVGLVARGGVFSLVGLLVIKAAADFRPDEATGVDHTLRAVAATTYGRWVMVGTALGLVAFGLYSFAEARFRRI